MSSSDDNDELKQLLRENSELLKQNHELLQKLHRSAVIGNILRVLWYGFLIGLPFLLYFLLEPYFELFGANYAEFQEGIHELPGVKGVENILNLR